MPGLTGWAQVNGRDELPIPEKVKLYEALLSREEMACAEDRGDYFRVPPDGRDLNYTKFVEQGDERLTQSSHADEYHSHNTTRLGCGRHEGAAA